MKPEKQQLIHELLDGESRREATLLTAAKILRRRRHRHAAGQILALVEQPAEVGGVSSVTRRLMKAFGVSEAGEKALMKLGMSDEDLQSALLRMKESELAKYKK